MSKVVKDWPTKQLFDNMVDAGTWLIWAVGDLHVRLQKVEKLLQEIQATQAKQAKQAARKSLLDELSPPVNLLFEKENPHD